jgi:hypothetical protein
MNIPVAVKQFAQEYEVDINYVKSYILKQHEFFKTIPDPATDFIGWLAFKMNITKAQAAKAWEWSKNEN